MKKLTPVLLATAGIVAVSQMQTPSSSSGASFTNRFSLYVWCNPESKPYTCFVQAAPSLTGPWRNIYGTNVNDNTFLNFTLAITNVGVPTQFYRTMASF